MNKNFPSIACVNTNLVSLGKKEAPLLTQPTTFLIFALPGIISGKTLAHLASKSLLIDQIIERIPVVKLLNNSSRGVITDGSLIIRRLRQTTATLL
jgi:hypothetical protein